MLATVKGDVHDIGKNLVDIILTNNGYNVVNLGIKQPISTILSAAEEHRADAVGMSGLLVKSTVIMKENLQEMNSRGIAAQLPVLLGGAALTRSYVENDLSEVYDGPGRLRPRRLRGPAADGRHDGAGSAASAAGRRPGRGRRRRPSARPATSARSGWRPSAGRPRRRRPGPLPARSDVAVDNPLPDAAVLGHPGGQGRGAGRVRRHGRRARAVPGAVGAARGPRRLRAVLRGAGGDRGPARACGTGWTGCPPRACSRTPRWSTATSRRCPRATRWWCSTERAGSRTPPARYRVRSSRASAATATCAWPTSGARASWPSSAARSTCCRCTW